MRIVRRTLTAVMFVLYTASLAAAQSAIGAVAGGVTTANPFGGVANLPYSATVKTTVVQKLADGTTITKVTTTKEARDSEGRSMHQVSMERPNGEPAIVNTTVNDPVNHTMTHWMNLSKQATIVHLPEPKSLAPNLSTRTNMAGGGLGSGEGQFPGATPAQMQASQPKWQREQLGGKTIAGVYAEGIRITRTIPEGAEGNNRPMIRVSETWHSPELQITLLLVNSDPRTGTRTTEVTELDRAEPDPALFQVPEGYTVKDQTMPVPLVH